MVHVPAAPFPASRYLIGEKSARYACQKATPTPSLHTQSMQMVHITGGYWDANDEHGFIRSP